MGRVVDTQSMSEQWIVERTSVDYQFDIGFNFLWTQMVDDPTQEMSLIRYRVGVDLASTSGSLLCPGGCGSFADFTTLPIFLTLGVPETLTVSIDLTAIADSPVPEPGAYSILAAGLMFLFAIKFGKSPARCQAIVLALTRRAAPATAASRRRR